MSFDCEIQVLVIDNGSSMCAAGYAGEESPCTIIPSIIGHSKMNSSSKDIYIGDEVISDISKYILNYPIEHGVIRNWDNMEKIWSYLYNNKLKVDVTEHPVLLTDAILNPKSNREKMIQIQFETFNVPAFYVAYQPYLPLLASGTKTGIVLESGGGVSQILPIYEFKCRKTEARKTNLAGESITDYLQILINEHENTFISNAEKDIIRDIKEKHSYVAIDYDEERYKFSTSSIREIKYTLPNKDIINISEERFKCGELLFKPMLNGFEEKGIHRIFYDSINSFKIEEQKSFYQNIVVSGGNTALKGFPERMYKEIVNIAPPSMCIKVIAPPELRYGVWIGGSIFASLNWFPQCVITRDEYDEEGTQIVHRMCQ